MDKENIGNKKVDVQKCGKNWFGYSEMERTPYQDALNLLAHGLCSSQLLIGVHLSDNGIMLNTNFCNEIMDIFGIPEEDSNAEAKET